MTQAISSIGVLSSLCGFALMMRFGFRLQSRIRFGTVMPDAEVLSTEEMREHRDDLRGRFGFFLAVAGTVLQAASAYCAWALP